MTEHSGQQASPADAIRRTLSEQQSQLHTHESALRELSARQAETNQRLTDLMNFLQKSVPQATPPDPAPAPDPAPPARPSYSEVRPPTPERFSGDIYRLTARRNV
ncbi:uncharacterized protein LOC111607673 [Xiphophorus maculatus]|uniref:uncharacterized protein LOC111607673 n=1 Tax=Xiphophorus maculatus TaxID=8083 RepID=UPI000C6EF3AA|nr:uncharacterized protein LOC111607673 [Xiphophorus maculatus]